MPNLHSKPQKLFFFKLLWSTKICVLLFFLVISAPIAHAEDNTGEELSSLTIKTQRGTSHTLLVELATTPQQQKRGLMFRKSMPKNQGMLFIYNEPQILTMWMQNTYISLDMLFVDQKGSIVSIAKNTQPLSLEVISSRVPAIAVIELNAGTVKELGIQTGDSVLHSSLTE